MEKQKFNIGEFNLETRIKQLTEDKAMALDEIANYWERAEFSLARTGLKKEVWLSFFLPLAEFGLTPDQMMGLVGQVPADFPLDHREIYYDFRLHRWINHIEPLSISECLNEYLENAESKAKGIAYLRGQWQGFLEQHGSA